MIVAFPKLNKIPNESRCIRILKDLKEKNGMVCQKCGNNSFYWKNDKLAFECKVCTKRISIRKGTIMENSKLPFNYWVIALEHRFSTREGNPKAIKINDVRDNLQNTRYATIWELSFKIDEILKKNNDFDIKDDPQETLMLKLLNLTSKENFKQTELLNIYLNWLIKSNI